MLSVDFIYARPQSGLPTGFLIILKTIVDNAIVAGNLFQL